MSSDKYYWDAVDSFWDNLRNTEFYYKRCKTRITTKSRAYYKFCGKPKIPTLPKIQRFWTFSMDFKDLALDNSTKNYLFLIWLLFCLISILKVIFCKSRPFFESVVMIFIFSICILLNCWDWWFMENVREKARAIFFVIFWPILSVKYQKRISDSSGMYWFCPTLDKECGIHRKVWQQHQPRVTPKRRK